MESMLHLEDFSQGQTFSLGTFSLSEEEIVEFARHYDPQPFHLDPVAATQSIFGSVIASGWQTCAEVMRLNCEAIFLKTAGLGSPGVDELRWKRPVRPNDKINAYTEVVSVRPSSSKPDRGLITLRSTAVNQLGGEVLSMCSLFMVKRQST